MKCLIHNRNIEVYQSQLFQTNTTIIKTDSAVFLIDPNWLPNEIEFLQNRILQIQKNNQLVLLFTHSDYDHIIGYRAFRPHATIASEAFVLNSSKAHTLKQIAAFDDSNYITRNYPIVYPTITHPVTTDGERLIINNETIETYQAKGHNEDGIITFFEKEKILVVGDYVSNVEFPYIYYSSLEYESTLLKIENLLLQNTIEYIIPGHGGIINQQQSLEIIQSNRKYIKEVRTAILAKTSLLLKNFDVPRGYPKIMSKYHIDNVKLIQKELNA